MGNILTQKRHKRDGTQIEDMTYRYKYDVNNKLLRNRLYHVNDAIAANVDDTDIDDMGAFVSNPLLIETANNYSYDEEGRLIKDTQEGIERITWRVDGKVKSIERPLDSGKKNVTFDYNAFGNRIAKHVFDDDWMLEKSTYYILDAQGNQLSMYEHVVDENEATVNYTLSERNIYGSSRLGKNNQRVDVFATHTENSSNTVLGETFYELSNHLGNVLTVINDIKIPLSDDNETVSEYDAGIVSISDYSPFGVQLDGRTVSASSYRYGFNGKEMDNEVSGNGNQYDYGFRIYNPRIAKFLSVDPLNNSFPWYTPYQFAGNMPISAVDLDGLEIYFGSDGKFIGKWGTNPQIRVIDNTKVSDFKSDLEAAINNPDSRVHQNVMDFYWRGSAGSSTMSEANMSSESIGQIMDYIYSDKTLVNGNLKELKAKKIGLIGPFGNVLRGSNHETDNSLSSEEKISRSHFYKNRSYDGVAIGGDIFMRLPISNNYYEIGLVLYHERLHLTQPNKYPEGAWGEFNAHYAVTQHKHYDKTSLDWKKENLDGMKMYLDDQADYVKNNPNDKRAREMYDNNVKLYEAEKSKIESSN